MSTIIRNGYRIRQTNMFELDRVIREFKSSARRILARAFYTRVAETAAREVDARALGVSSEVALPSDRSTLLGAVTYVRKRYHEICTTHRRDPDYDFDFHLSLMPREKDVLVLIRGEPVHGEVWKLWESFAEFEPFFYWNNTDAPEDVPEAEWEARGEAWKDLLSGEFGHLPSVRGYMTEVMGAALPLAHMAKVLPRVPSRELRARAVAINRLVEERVSAQSDVDKDALVGHVMEALEWTQGDGAETVRKRTEKIRPLLPEVTEDLLQAKVADLPSSM